jgi:hypothetical protein
MEIQLSHPHLADQLVRSLNETDCFAAAPDAESVAVFLPWLEPDGDAVQAGMELLFFVRAWGLRYPDFEARLA